MTTVRPLQPVTREVVEAAAKNLLDAHPGATSLAVATVLLGVYQELEDARAARCRFCGAAAPRPSRR